MLYLYDVAGVRIRCEIPFSIHIQADSREFIRADSGDAEMRFIFRPADLEAMPPDGHWEINQYHLETALERRIYHCPTRTLPPYACVRWPKDEPDTVYCDYVPGKESYLNYSHNLCDLLGLETLLLRHGGLLLHASFIRWRGDGILFSAPSGTGKSTQADLWARYEGAEILNGDRAGLRPLPGGWTAYGLPYAGTSGIYRNEHAPLRAVTVLRQGPTNTLQALTPGRAFRLLYPEAANHPWDRTFAGAAADALLRLVTEVPVYLLSCLPDRGAVQLLKESLPGKGD